MRRLPLTPLPQETLDELAKYQSELSAWDYKDQVARVSNVWKNKKQLKPFEIVKAKLYEMCSGENRCCYCEDSAADEIEHVVPKSVFPSLTFVWENYLFACGPCNGPKNNQFPLKLHATGQPTYFSHPKSGEKQPPPAGDPLLINPRIKDPTDDLMLVLGSDLKGLDFAPISKDPSNISYLRATYTIDVLRLNFRRDLAVRRKKAYERFKGALEKYALRKRDGASELELRRMQFLIMQEDYPTVWREIQRYRSQNRLIAEEVDPAFDALFDAVPEALTW